MQRFWSKVDTSGTCWIWTAGTIPDGYGKFKVNGKHVLAHRWAYEQEFGPVPEGLELDHLCRNRGCVNPNHLEPVMHVVNIRRGESPAALNAVKTHCLRGHEFTEGNTRHEKGGGRHCKLCENLREGGRPVRSHAKR